MVQQSARRERGSIGTLRGERTEGGKGGMDFSMLWNFSVKGVGICLGMLMENNANSNSMNINIKLQNKQNQQNMNS